MAIANDAKNNYGIVYTTDPLINQILDLIPKHYYENPHLKWLDVGAGNGAFSLNLYNRLVNHLATTFPNLETRRTHIIKNMITMCEIYPPHIEKLRDLFSQDANIITSDFLLLNKDVTCFDFIIGNPPYNINGALKTPTNKSLKKNNDGKQIYVDFVKKSLILLNHGGHLALIIPSLWLKPDKAGLYYSLLHSNFVIEKLHCLNTSETQKAFLYKAQTPTCFFYGHLKTKETKETKEAKEAKQTTQPTLAIYDKLNKCFVNYVLRANYPIPTNGISIINKLLTYVDKVGHLKVYKSNSPPKNSLFTNANANANPNPNANPNIQTTKLHKKTPLLIINYSNNLQHYANQPKLILAHKMYGFPYLDSSGIYGICARDNYILTSTDYSLNELKQIQAFLSTKIALFIFSTTNYRMRYLERYAFQFIPAITKLPDFPNLLNSEPISREKLIINFFNFSSNEETIINNSFANYNYFIDAY
jgi:tRNA1(Val) A37 N6-methylase TrmN6